MTRVFIVSDVRIYREGLAFALSRGGRLEVVGTAADAGELSTCVVATHPDIVLIDMGMPEAADIVETVHQGRSEVKLVALGVSENADAVLECAEAGIEGYVGRQASIAELENSVECVQRDELMCPPKIVAALFRQLGRLATSESGGVVNVGLTPRELDVVQLIDEGLSNKQIASRLNIQTATAKNHVHNALEKLGVHHRGEAAAKLRRARLLRVPRAR